MRIAIGGIMHESNSFNPVRAGLEDFQVTRGDELLAVWRDAAHEMSGFIEGGARFGFEPLPTLMATAIP
ncbi:MAG: M81 family metallopeptidase, partial [Acidobacteria bacterium]|nr:M81 family metallopeptidase [Acidobacteriota bacterium]